MKNPNNENNYSLNQILYGPPGTGKTYNTINKALEIIDRKFYLDVINSELTEKEKREKLKEKFDYYRDIGQIEVVTFHQSYGYEEFIEGIKAENEDGNLSYDITDGIFKKLCKNSRPIEIGKSLINFDYNKNKIFKISLGRTYEAEIREWCEENNYISLGWGDDIDYTEIYGGDNWHIFKNSMREFLKEQKKIDKIDQVNQYMYAFKNSMKIGDLVFVSKGNKKVVSIGQVTGNYEYNDQNEIRYSHFRKVNWLIKNREIDINNLYKKNMMQQTIYEFNKNFIKKDFLNTLLTLDEYAENKIFQLKYSKLKNEFDIKGNIIAKLKSGSNLEILKIDDEGITIKTNGKLDEKIKLRKDYLEALHLSFGTKENLNKMDNIDIAFQEALGKNFSSYSYYWGVLNKIVEYSVAPSINKGSINNYVLIIDEINRGNISKIFGELITLIEDNKRLEREESTEITLPYSGERFGVPDNLYILGTMNTADRSIALLDTALRRRFHFEEMMPQPFIDEISKDVKDKEGKSTGIDVQRLLETINKRIEYLYDRDHTIGHAYFIGVSTKEQLDSVMRNKVIPLLQEYFYDDWKKIQMVLGDYEEQLDKTDHENRFVIKNKTSSDDILGFNHNEIDSVEGSYKVNKEFSAGAYIKIYNGIKSIEEVEDEESE